MCVQADATQEDLHAANWMDHDLSEVSKAFNADDSVNKVAEALCAVALNWENEPEISYDIKNILNKAAQFFGGKDALEIAGCIGLIAEEGSSLHQTVARWYVDYKKKSLNI